MALKSILQSLDGLDDPTKLLYKKRDDGKFVLEVEGMVEKEKLDEFRASNVELKAGIEKLQADMSVFKDIDPAKYKELVDKSQSQIEKKLLEQGKLEEVVQGRTERMRKEFMDQIAAKDQSLAKLTEERSTAYKERDTYIVEAELRRQVDAPDFGFQPGVAELVKDQVLKEFVFKEGKVVRVKPDGSTVYGKSGGEPATIAEFLQDTVKDRPYLVKPSTGSGAHKTTNGGGNGAKTKTREQFDSLSPMEKPKFLKEGGAVVDQTH